MRRRFETTPTDDCVQPVAPDRRLDLKASAVTPPKRPASSSRSWRSLPPGAAVFAHGAQSS